MMIVPGMTEAEIERAVWLRITRWHKNRSDFMRHLFAYLIVNIVLWAIYLKSAPFDGVGDFPWPATTTLFWSIGVVIHGVNTLRQSPAIKARSEKAILDEVEREKWRLGLYEKAKRSETPLRMTDEGEFEPLDELLDSEDQEDAVPRVRTSRRG